MSYERVPAVALRTKPLRDQVAYHIRFWRRARHLSQTQLAHRVGVTRMTISRIESGRSNPSIELLDAVGVALGRRFSLTVWAQPPDDRVNVIK